MNDRHKKKAENTMRFIHTADLHLDVSLTAFPLDKQQILRAERIDNLRRLCEYAQQNAINIIVMAGDIYDSNDPQPDTVGTVISIMEQYEHIFFLVVPGNHDDRVWYSHPKPRTNNLILFGNSWTGQTIGADAGHLCLKCGITGIDTAATQCPSCGANMLTAPSMPVMPMASGTVGAPNTPKCSVNVAEDGSNGNLLAGSSNSDTSFTFRFASNI